MTGQIKTIKIFKFRNASFFPCIVNLLDSGVGQLDADRFESVTNAVHLFVMLQQCLGKRHFGLIFIFRNDPNGFQSGSHMIATRRQNIKNVLPMTIGTGRSVIVGNNTDSGKPVFYFFAFLPCRMAYCGQHFGAFVKAHPKIGNDFSESLTGYGCPPCSDREFEHIRKIFMVTYHNRVVVFDNFVNQRLRHLRIFVHVKPFIRMDKQRNSVALGIFIEIPGFDFLNFVFVRGSENINHINLLSFLTAVSHPYGGVNAETR